MLRSYYGRQKQQKGAISIKALTSKEKLFCTYYSLNRNAREAAAKSGYRFAEKTALRLLRRREIADEIAKIDEQRKATEKDIATGFRRLAFGCVSDAVSLIFKEEVSDADIESMDLFNIAEIKRKRGGDLEIKFFDRLKALEKLSEISCNACTEKENSVFSAIEKGAMALNGINHE